MRPPAAAASPGARARGCHCPGDGPGGRPPPPPPPRGPESPTPWRPWILTPQDDERDSSGRQLEPGGDQQTWGSPGAFGFQHPVRLYLPISKRQEYLQSSGEKVLASFPVQATIHFYNDESDEEEEEEEEQHREEGSRRAELQCQGAPGLEGNRPLLQAAPQDSSSSG